MIFHVDLDAFFVSVEVKLNPSLKGKPVILGGLGRRGVVSTASYEARRFGVVSGIPMTTARIRCPRGIFISGRHQIYGEYSKMVMNILAEFTPSIQQSSIDEAYMDMTGTEKLHGSPEQTAILIRKRVRKEVGITCSIGIGPNKLVAKIATEHAKPDGQIRIRLHEAKNFLAKLPIREMPGIGPKTGEKLMQLGILNLGQLANFNEGWLRRETSERTANYLIRKARGEDDSPVEAHLESKSLSAETTFEHDVEEWRLLRPVLLKLTERVGQRLRRTGKYASAVHIKARYGNFETVSRQTVLPHRSDRDETLFQFIEELAKETLINQTGGLRLIGVGVSGLGEPLYQMSLEDPPEELARPPVDRTLDLIRERFGADAVIRGSVMQKRSSPPVKANPKPKTKWQE